MKLAVFPNLTGLRGTERTIVHMRQLVETGKTDPKVVLQAHKLVRGVDRNNWTGMASAIFKFVHDTISYVRDPIGVEFVKSPAITLQTKTGDCDDQAVLFSALAESIGMKSRFKAVKADPKYPGEFSHVYSQVEIPGKGWVTADTIVPGAQFGWEAKGFAGRTWGGMDGMSFITMGSVRSLGDARLAAGSVGYDDDLDEELDTTFGEPFGDQEFASNDVPEDTGGAMWLNTPALVSPDETELSTDAGPDFWGGSTDLEPGPGLKSRMLPPGVGSLNTLSLRGASFGNIFKKAAKAIKTNLKNLKKDTKALVSKVTAGIGLSTPETREKASRAAVNQAMTGIWDGDGVQVPLELLRRAEDVITAQKEGRISQYVQGPPPAMGYFGAFGNGLVKQAAMTAALSTPQGQAISAASQIIKGLGDADDQKAAIKAIEKYATAFPMDRLEAASQTLTNAYVAAGGMMPSTSDKAPDAWLEKFRASARAGKPDKGGTPGWVYWDTLYLVEAMERIIPSVQAAKRALATAYQSHIQTAGQSTIAASANVVERALESGTITTDEVAAAVAITKKVAEGYALTPEEQALAARIAAGAKQAGAGGKGWMVAIPAAAVAAAALLL